MDKAARATYIKRDLQFPTFEAIRNQKARIRQSPLLSVKFRSDRTEWQGVEGVGGSDRLIAPTGSFPNTGTQLFRHPHNL